MTDGTRAVLVVREESPLRNLQEICTVERAPTSSWIKARKRASSHLRRRLKL